MKHISLVALLAAVTLVSLALAQDTPPGATQPAATGPASQPSGPKVKLAATLKPGEAWSVVAKITNESTHQFGDQPPAAYKEKGTLYVLLTVDKAAEGNKALQATFKRAKDESEHDGQKKSYDSDDPNSDTGDKALKALVNSVMKMQMDGKNKVVVTEGLGKFLDSMGAPDDPAEKQKMIDGFNGIFCLWLLGGFDFLPPQGEAAVGETWTLKREVASFSSGPEHKEKQKLTCKLASVDKTKDGRIATVEITGEGKPDGRQGEDAEGNAINYSGHAQVNVDKQQLISFKLEGTTNKDKNSRKTVLETTFAPADPKAATTTAPAASAPATKEAVEDRL